MTSPNPSRKPSAARKKPADRLRRLRRRRPRRPRAADGPCRRAARQGRRRRRPSRRTRRSSPGSAATTSRSSTARSATTASRSATPCGPGSSSRPPRAVATWCACSTATRRSTRPAREEAVGCAKAGIPFEVVPGVSSITAVPAYAGIPLTSAKHREVRVVNVAEGTRDAADWSSARRRPGHPGAAVGDRRDRRGGQGARRRGPLARDAGGDDPAGHHDDAAHGDLDARAHRRRRQGRQAGSADHHGASATRSARASRCPGSRPSRCSAGGCWCRAPRSRPARCPSSCVRYGAVPEEVPTISVEPPRTPQQMERAVKGLVSGRYQWVAFTSRNAVQGGPREVRGVRPRRPRVRRHQGRRGRRADRCRLRRLRGQARPGSRAASSRPPGCSRTGRRTTRCSTRSTGSSCRAPTSPPRPGGRPGRARLGGRRRHGVPHGAGRAAGRADPRGDQERRVRRRASSPRRRTVRNLVGIAGKPHASTVIACIGPADREDRRGARSAGRRPRAVAVGGRARRRRWRSTARRCGLAAVRRASRCCAPRRSARTARRKAT